MKMRYVCPFCFRDFAIGDVMFACESGMICGPTDADGKIPDVNRGQQENCPELARYFSQPNFETVHHFPPSKKSWFSMPTSAVCDRCHRPTRRRLCKGCHNQLPPMIDSNDEIIIALIGSRGSGKSTYIGVLIKELQKKLLHNYNATFRFTEDRDREQYKNRFERALFEEKHVLNMTASNMMGTTQVTNIPILCDIRFAATSKFRKPRNVTLVFFDSAGEDWADANKVSVVADYVAHAAGIIFLIDPLEYAAVRNQIDDENVVQASKNTGEDEVPRPSEIIERVARLVRNGTNAKETDKVHIPTAIAFSKLDVLADCGFFKKGQTVVKDSPHERGAFDEADCEMVNEEVQSLLDEWDQEDFMRNVASDFDNYSCFAFSAMGKAPVEGNRIDVIRPQRIADAMLWILHKNHVI